MFLFIHLLLLTLREQRDEGNNFLHNIFLSYRL